MKKKIALTVVLGLLATIILSLIVFNMIFIIKQSNIETAYFYKLNTLSDLSNFEFTNEWVEHLHGNSIAKVHLKSIIVAIFNVFIQIISLVYIMIKTIRLYKKHDR